MKIFITGGTGFVGQEIVGRLHLVGHSIRMLVRNPRASLAKELAARYRAEISPGDVLEQVSLDAVPRLEDVDAVIHLVGIISEVGRCTFENIHTGGTSRVVAAAKGAGVKRFIYMSALGTRAHAVSRYHQTKWAAEEIVRQSGLDYTIFRPSLIYGPRDQFVNLFAKIIRLSPVVPVLGSPRARFQPVSIDPVATAFVKAVAEPQAIGQTYDLCGPEKLTLPQILDVIMRAMGRKRLKLQLPNGLARFQAALLEFVFPRLLRKAPPLNRDQLTMLQEDNVGNAIPANDLFELQHPGFEEGIAAYLKH